MHLNLQALRETEKSYDDTQEIVAYLLDGNPIGRVFLMTALQHYAKEVIEYVDNLPEDAASQGLLSRMLPIYHEGTQIPQSLYNNNRYFI